MKKQIIIVLLSVILTAFTVSVMAQTSGSGRAQRQNGGHFSAMREKYKYTFQLMRMTGHIAEIDKNKKHTLTPAQAKQVLFVLKPLREKPKLTQDQAKQALKKLEKIFTASQLNAMAKIKPRLRQGQGPRMAGDGQRQGMGNNGRDNGNREHRRWDPNAMKDFNPFYTKAPKGDERVEVRAKRWNEFFNNLEKKAHKK